MTKTSFASVLAALASTAPFAAGDGCGAIAPRVTLEIAPTSGTTLTCIYSQARAFVSCAGSVGAPCEPGNNSEGWGDVHTVPTSCGAFAVATCDLSVDGNRVPCNANTGANVTEFKIDLFANVDFFEKEGLDANNEIVYCCPTCSVATSATGAITVTAASLKRASWNYTIDSEIPAFDTVVSNRRLTAVLFKDATGNHQVVGSIIETPNGSVGVGLAYNSGTDSWTGSSNGNSTASSANIGISTCAFTDAQLDVDNDGRFSINDSIALTTIASSTDNDDPQNLSSFDFDGSNLIDQGDVDIMNALLDADLDSGLLGDWDGDGDVDCEDINEVDSSLFNDSIGTLGYNVRLDADLDGDTDSSDESAVMALYAAYDRPADFDNSGFVDTDDYDAFYTAFENGDPSADFDNSGFVDTDDFTAFVQAFENTC